MMKNHAINIDKAIGLNIIYCIFTPHGVERQSLRGSKVT